VNHQPKSQLFPIRSIVPNLSKTGEQVQPQKFTTMAFASTRHKSQDFRTDAFSRSKKPTYRSPSDAPLKKSDNPFWRGGSKYKYLYKKYKYKLSVIKKN
jgi:hypothetical protein